MTCTQLSTLQPEATTTLLPGTPPTNNQEWQAVRIALQTVLQQIRAAAGVTGVNAVPQQYALFAGSSLPPMTFSGCSGSLDTSNVLFGAGSLKLALSSDPASVTFASDTAWPIAHNRSWIVSFYAMASETTNGTITITTPKASYKTDFTLPAGSTFARYYDTLNLIADGSTSFGLSFSFTSGTTVWLDGIQLEPYYGVAIAPSPFISTSPALTLDNQPDGSTYVRLAASHAAGNVAYNYRGVWSSTTAYVQGDEVVYEASYWLATSSSTGETPATGSSYWQVVGSYSGFQGAWSSTASYVQGAEVTYNGNYWVCVRANTDSAPSTTNSNWQIAGPSALDNIGDGPTTYQRMPIVNMDANRRALIDFSQPGHIDKTLDFIPDGGTRYGTYVPPFSAGAISLNRTLIDAGNGAIIGRGPFAPAFDPSGAGNFWQTNTSALPTSVVVDLGASFNEVVTLLLSPWFPADNRSLPSAGTVDISTDNVTWTTGVCSWTDVSVSPIALNLGGVLVRYVRINLTGAPLNPGTLTITTLAACSIINRGGNPAQNLDVDVLDGTIYTRTLGSVQTGNIPDLSKGILNKVGANITRIAGAAGTLDASFLKGANTDPDTLDSVPDGNTYARTRASVLGSNLPLRPAIATILSLNPTHYWPISGPQGYAVDLGSSPSTLQPISTGSVVKADLAGLSGRLAPGDAQPTMEFETNGAQYASGTNGLTALVVGGVIASPAADNPSGPLVVIGAQPTNPTSPSPSSSVPLLYMTPDGYAHASVYTSGTSGGQLNVTSPLTYTFRDPHLLAMQASYDSSTGVTTLYLFVDGENVAMGSISAELFTATNYYTIGGVSADSWPGFGSGFTSNAVLIQDVFVIEGRILDTADYFALFQALTPGRGTSSGFLYRGSVPPQSSTASFSYTSTTTSITISWGAFTVYWADGTTQSVSSGSQEFTGLSASTTYYFYPYLRQADGTIQFAGGANTARSASNASLASHFGVVPLSSGAITASTPASGTGGGGIGACLHESQPVLTRHGMVPAGELKVGDELWTPEGEWAPILTVRAEPETEWVSINGLLVTKTQPFMTPEGKPIRAAYLELGERIRTEEGEMPVVDMRFVHEPARKIILGIRPPHWFILTPHGPIVHNGSVKP